jgi:mannose-1-phosphate guanylyltransferase/mannose-1-phosphate guanylyltransferase/mannose-6-phosphate isomerase
MNLGGHSLFGDTLNRLQSLPDALPPVVVCNEAQRFLAAAQLQDAGLQGEVILEPVGRNTAPAIAAAALAALDAPESQAETFLLVLPSDHALDDHAAFGEAVDRAIRLAAEGRLVTFGIRPDKPETAYGWIERGQKLPEDPRGQTPAIGWAVRRFVEKPDPGDAGAMLRQGGYCWNSGMFCFSPRLYLAELELHAPRIYECVCRAFEGRRADPDFIRLGSRAFSDCPSDSIDYAVMEKTNLAAVTPLETRWSDLGSWESVWLNSRTDADGNALVGDAMAESTTDSYLHSSGRLVAALGLKGIVVVETGDAVLVADKSRTQEIRKIVDRLAKAGRAEKDTHLRVFRPWGWYETLSLGDRFQVKRIMVKPGAALSLQMHYHRAEHWVVVRGTGQITVDGETRLLYEDQSGYIPLGVKHRLCNPGKVPLEIIEVQSGAYLGEDDIARFDDEYGRDGA